MHTPSVTSSVYARRPRWRRPRLVTYRPADTAARAMWNRYPNGIIGCAFVLGGRCYSLVWKRP